jgi:preprotein translocase subunit YajC
MLLISPAFAEGAAAAAQPSPIPQFILMAGMLVLFYFILWRPQAKQRKLHKQLMDGLGKGDEVVLSGGLLGRVLKLDDNYAVLEIANDVSIKIQKSAVVSALPKGTLKAID